MRDHLDGVLQSALADVREADGEDDERHLHHPDDLAGGRYARRFVDGERGSAHTHLLWCADSVSPILLGVRLRDLFAGVAALGQFVDHHRHHRCGIAGCGTGTWCKHCLDSGRDYLGGILRRQDVSAK